MSTQFLRLRVITPSKALVDLDNISVVTAPGSEGELGILPKHIPLFTRLKSGVIMYRTDDKKNYFGVTSGFMDVQDNVVTVLADDAILPEEANVGRAEEAKRKAEEAMQKRLEGTDFQKVEAEMRKALLELKLIEHIK